MNGDQNFTGKPRTDYMLQAEDLLLKDIQHQLMSKAKASKWQREFGLYQDERGIVRFGVRLKNANLSQTQKHPAILDTEHYVTSLIVKESHQWVKHNGVKATLTDKRSRFWTVRGRQYVRRYFIHECAICWRQEGSAYVPPGPPALTTFRITKDQPFTYSGEGFTGRL